MGGGYPYIKLTSNEKTQMLTNKYENEYIIYQITNEKNYGEEKKKSKVGYSECGTLSCVGSLSCDWES